MNLTQIKKCTIGVLALQGAFIEHKKMLQKLGANVIELRQKKDLDQKFDGLILPGGESTVQGKLLNELDMLQTLKQKIINGMPVLATCAGLILLATHIQNDNNFYLATLPVVVKRNAYGRQLGSFSMSTQIKGISTEDFPMEFIRAPYITSVNKKVEIIATDKEGHIVGVKYKNQYAYAFHPELTNDCRLHQLFLDYIETK